MDQKRNDLLFTTVYSIHLENMMSTLLGRVDKILVFLQIFLGIAVVTNYSPVVFGLAISTLAAIQFVWQPGIKSGQAKASHDRWHNLLIKIDDDSLSTKKLLKEVDRLSEKDSFVLSSLKLPAHISTCRKLALSDANLPKLTFWQKVLSNLSGAII